MQMKNVKRLDTHDGEIDTVAETHRTLSSHKNVFEKILQNIELNKVETLT